MSEHEEFLDRVVDTLREPVHIDPALDRRVMAEIEAMPQLERPSTKRRSAWDWLTQRQTISVRPIGVIAMAAMLAVVFVVGERALNQTNQGTSIANLAGPASQSGVQFVFVAPAAASVSLVGDFNDWNVGATPLVREEGDGVWSVTVPLTPGRYRYSFLVDGTMWLRDPQAARTIEDEFGRPNSVLTIGGV